MTDRLSTTISAGLHLLLAILLAFGAKPVLVAEKSPSGMEIEIVDTEYALLAFDPSIATSADASASVPAAPASEGGASTPTRERRVDNVQQAVEPRLAPQVPAPQLAPAPVASPNVARVPMPQVSANNSAAEAVTPAPPEPRPIRRMNPGTLSRSLQDRTSRSQPTRLNSAAVGSAIGTAAPRGVSGMTVRQRTDLAAMVRAQVIPCWNPPLSEDQSTASIKLTFNLSRTGSVQGQPEVSQVTGRTPGNSAYVNLLINSGRRAVMLCSPLELPPELYDAWSRVEVEFDPRNVR